MKTLKKAKWDCKRKIKLTPRYIRALRELGKAEIEMMRTGEDGCLWVWCDIRIIDLASSLSLSMIFGGLEERPKAKVGDVNIIVE